MANKEDNGLSEGCSHNHDKNHQHGGTNDYMKAVSEYKKSFPSKQDVINNTPDPAIHDMLLHMEQIGCENAFDRFDKQKPQCNFGIAGTCCKNCFMGPCKITPKSPKGVCGANADLIVARNVLRSLAAGTAAHGVHGREVVIALRKAAEGELNLPIRGDEILEFCVEKFEIERAGKTKEELVFEVTDVLLDDMSRTKDGTFKLIESLASRERQKVWEDMDIIPISAYHEVFEAFHKTNCGTDGEWKNIMKQFGRCGLAFLYSGVVTPYLATDILFGHPVKHTAKVNVGAIKEGFVNIAVHGHLPTLVSEVIKHGRSKEFVDLAKKNGAKGIQFYGICCTGLAALYRYKDVIPLSNAVGAELVLGTGALDLWLADIQDVFPGIMEVAKCFRTTVVTTSDSARLPGAEHYGYNRHHTNFNETETLAKKIVTRGIESFTQRRDVSVFIPSYEVEAEVGFSPEYIEANLGMNNIANAIKEGKVLGIVNVVGCCNPRVVYERAIVDIVDKLIKNNVIILTNGCASFPLLKLGFCKSDATLRAGNGLKNYLPRRFPPVWHMGECIDNARCVNTLSSIATAAGVELKDMPFAMSSPEWSNEKAVGASFCFRLLGINSYHCVYPAAHGSQKVMNYIMNAKDTLGSTMTVDIDPLKLADIIIDDLRAKRKKLGWS
jgi:anaerobic carbon-monoxide dehydrogenase catalytic subunit